HAVRAVTLDRVHVCRRDHLHGLLPRGAHEPTPAPLAPVQPHLLRVVDDLGPRHDRITESRPRLAKHRQQASAYVWILQPDRRVLIPRERSTPATPPRFVLRQFRTR